jgi:hypothetical protein
MQAPALHHPAQLLVGKTYQMTATSAMGITTATGVFQNYNAEGLPLFTSETMGSVIYDPALGWTFTCLQATL